MAEDRWAPITLDEYEQLRLKLDALLTRHGLQDRNYRAQRTIETVWPNPEYL